MSQRRHLIPFLEQLDSAVVGCAGDLMLDRFLYGSVNRISPEAPIPILHVENERAMLGGLGNVIRNLGSLGCGIRLFSLTGDDPAGSQVATLLKGVARCETYLLTEGHRRTPVKVRYIAHGQQLLRADDETTEIAGDEVFQSLLGHFEAHVAECSIVFLSDYSKGLLKGSHAQAFIRIAQAAGKPVVVDPKGHNFERYLNATVIKPNLKELAEATGLSTADNDAQEFAARRLLDLTQARFILLTRGPAGMLLVPRDEPRAEFFGSAREVYDVSGAGDTVAAVLAAALGSGAGIREAVELANIAAGIVVGKVGTAVVSRSEIIDAIENESAITARGKISRPEQIVDRVDVWRRMGRRIGFAYGSFHPLSSNRLELLEQARLRCDRLVVAMVSDASTPAEAGDSGAYLLASLANVDAVVRCDPQSPVELMRQLRPNLVVCLSAGGDFEKEQRLIAAWNGELLLVESAGPNGNDRLTLGNPGAMPREGCS